MSKTILTILRCTCILNLSNRKFLFWSQLIGIPIFDAMSGKCFMCSTTIKYSWSSSGSQNGMMVEKSATLLLASGMLFSNFRVGYYVRCWQYYFMRNLHNNQFSFAPTWNCNHSFFIKFFR